MNTLTPLSYLRHSGLGWTPRLRNRQSIRRDPALGLDELSILALTLPVVIRVAGGRVEPVVPLGILAETALAPFDARGNWQLRVAPSEIFETPFKTMSSAAGSVVMVDEGLLKPLSEASTPLFADDGSLDPKTKAETLRLDGRRQAIEESRKAAAALRAAGLLQPWNSTPGLFCVDAKKLAGLGPDVAGRLHVAHALYLGHLCIQSARTLDLARRPSLTTAAPPSGPKTQKSEDESEFLAAFKAEVL